MPIIENYKQYGIPDLPVNPDTGKARIINLFIVGCGARADGYLQPQHKVHLQEVSDEGSDFRMGDVSRRLRAD